MHRSARAWAIALFAMGLASLATPVAAHIVKQVGPYSVAIGWVHEPTYVGQLNAVQVVIKDARGNPVSDLSADALKVVAKTAARRSPRFGATSMRCRSTRTPVWASPATTRRR